MPNLLRCFVMALMLASALPAGAGIYDDILTAANQDNTAKVIDLLRRGMDVNTADRAGNTLAIIAARNGNNDLLDFLLRNRANLLKKNKFGDSALMAAAIQGHTATVRRLLDAGAEVRTKGWNALHYSAFAGHADIVRLLIEGKADLDAKAPNGQTALMLAAGAGHLAVVKLLINADADMDLEDYDGNPAIVLARKTGHVDVAEYLRDEGAVE